MDIKPPLTIREHESVDKFLQRDFTSDLAEVEVIEETVITDLAVLGISVSVAYDQGEVQAIADKVDECVNKINEINAKVSTMVSGYNTIVTELNKTVRGLTVK